MEITEHGLKKQTEGEFYDVNIVNDNTDIVEDHLGDSASHTTVAEKTGWNAKVNQSDVIESTAITESGKIMAGKTVAEEFAKINQSINKYNYKYIILTDDDSKSSTYTTWYPLLKAYNIHGSISAIMFSSDYAGNCTKDQLLEMQENGFDILNHSSSTDSITTSNMKTIIPYALTIAKNNGYIAAQEIFVYPNGNDDSDVETYVYENFIAALGVTGTGNTNPLNFMNLCRINVDDSHEQATITSYVYNQVTDSDMVILCTHSYNGVSNLTAILEHYKNDNTVRFVSMTEYNYLFNIYQLSTERGLYMYGINNLNQNMDSLNHRVSNCILEMSNNPTYSGLNVTTYGGTRVLIPNGKNADGTLNSIDAKLTANKVYTGLPIGNRTVYTNETFEGVLYVSNYNIYEVEDFSSLPTTVANTEQQMAYVKNENKMYRAAGSTTPTWVICTFVPIFEYSAAGTAISLLTTRKPFRMADYNEVNESLTKMNTNFQDGCSTIASAITANGVTTASNASPATMSTNIGNIRSGGTLDAAGNQLLAGYTAITQKVLRGGSMPNRGSWSTTINPGGNITIPIGYHNGIGTVTANGTGLKTVGWGLAMPNNSATTVTGDFYIGVGYAFVYVGCHNVNYSEGWGNGITVNYAYNIGNGIVTITFKSKSIDSAHNASADGIIVCTNF